MNRRARGEQRRGWSLTAVPAMATLSACLVLLGCASGNAPDFTSTEVQTLFLSASGTWAIEEEYSEPASRALEPMSAVDVRAPGPDAEAVQDFYPIARRMDTNRSNVTSRQEPAAMRQVVLMTSIRPDRLQLSLTGQTFSVRYGDGETWNVPMTGGRLSVPGNLYPTEYRIVWEEGGSPTLEGEVRQGGVLRDNFQVISTGRLVLTRQAVFSGEVWQPTRFVYTRVR